MHYRLLTFFLTALLTLRLTSGYPSPQQDFQNPPLEKGPWVYWMWMNGNITREGITEDLEAMERVGVAGVLIMSVTVEIPEGPVKFFSEEWQKLFQHAVSEADRLGLQVVMNNDAGFTGSGGPWNTVENSMQRITWSETVVDGPATFNGKLPQPPTQLDYYKDIAVYALKTPDAVKRDEASVTVTSSQPGADMSKLVDGDPYTTVQMPIPKPNRPTWFQWEYDQPTTIHAFSLRSGFSSSIAWGFVQASDDGTNWRNLTNFYIPNAGAMQTYAAEAFAPTTAKFFRVLIHRTHPRVRVVNMAEIELHTEPRISEWGAKGGYVRGQNIQPEFGGAPADDGMTNIHVITAALQPDGTLTWPVPEGRWTILRLGHTAHGKDNHPAPEAGKGLEVDKMSAEALTAHFDAFLGKLIQKTGPLAGKSFVGTHIDSWEVGAQNWTPQMIEKFKALRGYDPLPYLPAISEGYILYDRERTERFLWDFRKTIADLIADDYYGKLQSLAEENGMFLSVEAYNNGNFDNILSAGRTDIPMNEFWVGQTMSGRIFQAKQATAAAQGYGRNIVAAEAFTCGTEFGRWQNSPASLKALGDYFYAAGTNRFIFHRWAMQPWTDRWPGMTFGPYGIHYERTLTWFEQSRAWIQYMARCQTILQQGTFVGDLLIFQGEGTPNGAPAGDFDRSLGYDYGYCNDETIMSMTVENGHLVMPASGTRYRLLVLDNTHFMTPELAQKIAQLVEAGAHVLGPKPTQSPSLTNYPECDLIVRQIGERLWGDTSQPGSKTTGKGTVHWGKDKMALIRELQPQPDLVAAPPVNTDTLAWMHRTLPDMEFYYLSNQKDEPLSVDLTLRVNGKAPELWHPETGEIRDIAIWEPTADGRTRLPLTFEPTESVFVVFRRPPSGDPIVALTRNGQPMDTAPQATGNFEITKALYAQIDNPTASANITDQLKNLLKPGGSPIQVHPKTFGIPDPAVHKPKQLIIDYTVGDRTGQFTATDMQQIQADELVRALSGDGVQVVKATYGIPGHATKSANVTARVQQIHKSGATQVRAFPTDLGVGDPAPGIVKTLSIAFKVDGEQVVLEATDTKYVTFPAAKPQARPWIELRGGKVIASVPGTYEARHKSGSTQSIAVDSIPEALALTGPWTLTFPPQTVYKDAPLPSLNLDTLVSWTQRSEPQVRHFSGTGVYEVNFTLTDEQVAEGVAAKLDLGKVGVIAEAKLNGHDLGILWTPPFEAEVTQHLRAGENTLRVEITNTWVNQLIADAAKPSPLTWNRLGAPKNWPEWINGGPVPDTGRKTFITWDMFKPNEALQPSGLMGPVTLTFARIENLK